MIYMAVGIAIIIFLLGFKIVWTIFNAFLSLEDAVHLSTFEYYLKKILWGISGGIASLGLAAWGYAYYFAG